MTTQQKGLSIINNAVGLNLQEYTMSLTEYPSESYPSVTPQENLGYTFKSNTGEIKFSCTFANGALQILYLMENNGIPILTKSAKTIHDRAKDFLNSYQDLSGKSFYGQLASTLDNVDDRKNSTATFGNMKLQITNLENSKTFAWSYTFNEIDASSKCVSLMYKDGFLKYFVDNWDLNKIGSTKINLSEEQAVAIAIDLAKAYSWTVGLDNETVEINNFKVTKAMEKRLVFCNSINADNQRGEDFLMLYPMWRIGIGLDKFYPGDVFGIYVDIWADTEEIRKVKEIVSPIPPLESKVATIQESTTSKNETPTDATMQNSLNWVALIACSTIILVVSPLLMIKTQKFQKSHTRKITGALLCLFIALPFLSFSIDSVNASNRATVWGSLAQAKESTELDRQAEVCSYITNLFEDNSYVTTNYQGENTVEAIALDAIDDDEDNYQYVATVWFDHGIGYPLDFTGYQDEWHFRLCDSTTPNEDPLDGYIYDYQIFDATQGSGKTFFSFISTCMSARLDLTNPLGGSLGAGTYGPNLYGSQNIIGMPYAWTHGANMNPDGYGDPDDGEYCYIGFPWGSPSLSYYVEGDYQNIDYSTWVTWFFIFALNPDFSVNQALDEASLHCFSKSFGETDLRNNFITHWYGSPEYDECTMAVYGNGNIRLKNYDPSTDSVGRPTVYGPPSYVGLQTYTEYTFTVRAADSQGHDIHYLFDWGDSTSTWVPGEYDYSPSGEYVQTTHSWSTTGEKTITVTAQCENEEWSTSSPSYEIRIGNWYWLYFNAVEYNSGDIYTNIYVDNEYVAWNAYASVFLSEGYHTIEVDSDVLWENGWCYFDYFDVGETNYYDNPLEIYLDGSTSITAYYCYY